MNNQKEKKQWFTSTDLRRYHSSFIGYSFGLSQLEWAARFWFCSANWRRIVWMLFHFINFFFNRFCLCVFFSICVPIRCCRLAVNKRRSYTNCVHCLSVCKWTAHCIEIFRINDYNQSVGKVTWCLFSVNQALSDTQRFNVSYDANPNQRIGIGQ